MPRQPFLPTFANLDYAVGARTLNDRPEFCAAIGKCIALWSYADNEMGNLFGILLGSQSDAALEVFLCLRRTHNQIEALQLAAKIKLTGDELQAFNAIVSEYKSLESERNSLAHGCFGVCSDPSILLWIDVKDHVHVQTEVFSAPARGKNLADPHERLKNKLYVYRLTDLQALYGQMEQFWEASRHFNSYLRNPTNSAQVEEFKRLRELPLIKKARKN